jgi:hypothetical protein
MIFLGPLRAKVRAEAQHPGRAMWTALPEITTETDDLVHGKAATAAARAGDVTAALIHVTAGVAAQAVYQLCGRPIADRHPGRQAGPLLSSPDLQ